MSNPERNPVVKSKVLIFGLNFLRGGLIGIAEIIPGVSGGTIALITGVYTRIINSASDAVRGFLLLFGFSRSKLAESGNRFKAMSWALLILLGLGPLGASFYFWDAALKIGDPRRIGLLAFLTPLLSTALLVVVSGRALSWQLAVATALIVGGAVLGSKRVPSKQ